MAPGSSCDYCGRFRGRGTDPHPEHHTCPHRENHEDHNGELTLRETVQATSTGNSVCLLGWNRSYPSFKTVTETRAALDTYDSSTETYEGHEKYETSYFTKTIWATGNPHKVDANHRRIEYDPTAESLIQWYTITEEGEEKATRDFETFIRKDKPDVSFFGSTLPG